MSPSCTIVENSPKQPSTTLPPLVIVGGTTSKSIAPYTKAISQKCKEKCDHKITTHCMPLLGASTVKYITPLPCIGSTESDLELYTNCEFCEGKIQKYLEKHIDEQLLFTYNLSKQPTCKTIC